MKTDSRHILFWLIFTAAVATTGVQAEIYSWTDENGVRHYSDTPPEHPTRVEVHEEIPHDREQDRKNQEAHQELLERTAVEQRQQARQELEGRLERTERKLQDAEKKARQALKAAEEARAIAEEKQRLREVYVLPWIGPGIKPPGPGTRPPRPGQRPPRPEPYRQPRYPAGPTMVVP